MTQHCELKAAARNRRFQFSLRTLSLAWLVVPFTALVFYAILHLGAQCDDFSFDSFEVRVRSSSSILPTQVLRRYNSRNELVTFLVAHGYWTPRITEHPKWHAFYYREGYFGRGHYEYAGRMLSRGREQKIEWTAANPDFAKVFWPWLLERVRTEAEPESYLSDDVWRAAREAGDFEEFANILGVQSGRTDLNLAHP